MAVSGDYRLEPEFAFDAEPATPQQTRRARLQCALHGYDAPEVRYFLDALGLTP